MLPLTETPVSEELLGAVHARLSGKRIAGAETLYVHWLTLRNPRARFSADRPKLPQNR